MNFQRLFPFILVVAVGCRTISAEQSRSGAAGGINPSDLSAAAASTEVSLETNKQIELNETVLLTYSDESKRIDAANLLLFDKNPSARQVLIKTLGLTNNSPARIAICKALIQTRTTQQEVPNKNDFIEPLLNIFSTKVDEEARWATDTLLIYKYQEISPLLDKMVTDSEKPAKTRINVIETLRKIPEMDAIIKLYRLVDDPNQEVSSVAGSALRSLGFQPGTTSSEREKSIADLREKGIVEVLRERLISQDSQINQYKADFESLRNFTKAVQEDAYVKIGVDDASKCKFLTTYLADSRTWVKSWALDKVLNWRKTPQTSIPAEIEPVIIALVSDPSKEIRLKTVGLIGLLQPMKTPDLAQQLLIQFEAEQDDQVKIKLLESMGIVCSTALSQTSSIKITPDLRLRVLGYASEFLSSDDPSKAKIGANVIRQFLEREGMQEQDIKIYFGQLTNRYNRQRQDPNSSLMPELLNVMVGLVADSSASKDYARKTFDPIFKEALNFDTDFLRETAIDGLGYINKTNALKILRDRIKQERSEKARLKIIKFAEDVGGREDLDWLAGRLGPGNNSEAKQAWTAMIKIFSSSDIDVLIEWETQLISPGGKYNLSEQQKIDFLKLIVGNAKTTAKNKQKYYEQIANRYYAIGQYEQAINYFNLYNATATTDEKNNVLPKFLDSCLRLPNENLASTLMMEYLTNNNINADNPILVTIENYFKDANVVNDKNAILEKLRGIKLSQLKPVWQTKLRQWGDLISKNEPEKTDVSKVME